MTITEIKSNPCSRLTEIAGQWFPFERSLNGLIKGIGVSCLFSAGLYFSALPTLAATVALGGMAFLDKTDKAANSPKVSLPPVPLKNEGNTCFLASCMQIVTNDEAWTKEILRQPGDRPGVGLVKDVVNTLCSAREGKALPPSMDILRPALHTINPNIPELPQQADAHEALMALFHHSDPKTSGLGVTQFTHNFAKKWIPEEKFFGGLWTKESTFEETERLISYNCIPTLPIFEVPLTCNAPGSYIEGLPLRSVLEKNFFIPDCPKQNENLDDLIIRGNERYGHLRQKVQLSLAPDRMLFMLKRMRAGSSLKILASVAVPDQLDLRKVIGNHSDATYELRGYVLHHGPRVNGGHYTAYVAVEGKNGSGKRYFHCNDGKIEEVTKGDFIKNANPPSNNDQNSTVYLLNYAKTTNQRQAN